MVVLFVQPGAWRQVLLPPAPVMALPVMGRGRLDQGVAQEALVLAGAAFLEASKRTEVRSSTSLIGKRSPLHNLIVVVVVVVEFGLLGHAGVAAAVVVGAALLLLPPRAELAPAPGLAADAAAPVAAGFGGGHVHAGQGHT